MKSLITCGSKTSAILASESSGNRAASEPSAGEASLTAATRCAQKRPGSLSPRSTDNQALGVFSLDDHQWPSSDVLPQPAGATTRMSLTALSCVYSPRRPRSSGRTSPPQEAGGG